MLETLATDHGFEDLSEDLQEVLCDIISQKVDEVRDCLHDFLKRLK